MPTLLTNASAGATLSVSLEPDLSAVREAAARVLTFLTNEGIAPDDVLACVSALVEACNNAILYAKGGSRGRPVELDILCNSPWVELHVGDHTPGFEWPVAIELPDSDQEYGRGLFIIQSLMEETLYLRGKTENRLIMRRHCATRTVPTASALEPAKGPPETLTVSGTVVGALAREVCLLSELEIARNIQQSLLPKNFPPLPGFGLSGFCLSAHQVGGDFYDVLPLRDQAALLVVADVMGKGVPAALFAASLRTRVRTMADWTQHPADLLRRINRLMFEELSGVDMFITVQLVLADTRKRQLMVASAGHCPLLLTNSQGQTCAVTPEGMPLGIVADVAFTEEVVPLEPGAGILLYTDGLTEARNSSGHFFGQERLLQWLCESARTEQPAAQRTLGLLEELNRFQSESPPRDDLTFLILCEEAQKSQLLAPAITLPAVSCCA
jgi:anti-sigma regulatory factor (Ser/Thr protein kinase)